MHLLRLRSNQLSECGGPLAAKRKIDSTDFMRRLLGARSAWHTWQLTLMCERHLPLLQLQGAELAGGLPKSDRPISFFQQFIRLHWADDRVDHAAAGRAEIAGDVAPLFDNLAVDVS